MHTKLGIFEAYTPTHKPEEILLRILKCMSSRIKIFHVESHELYSFFYRVKSKHPELLKDFYFNNDSNFPYSPEVEEAFSRLQEYAYLTRHNLSLETYQMNFVGSENLENFTDDEKKAIKSISNEFAAKFGAEI